MQLPGGWDIGIVKWFGAIDVFQGRYGFLVFPYGPDVFFHEDGMCTFVMRDGEPILVEYTEASKRPWPKTGDQIMFRSLYSRAGTWTRPHADFWGFADEYESIRKQMESRRIAATT